MESPEPQDEGLSAGEESVCKSVETQRKREDSPESGHRWVWGWGMRVCSCGNKGGWRMTEEAGLCVCVRDEVKGSLE